MNEYLVCVHCLQQSSLTPPARAPIFNLTICLCWCWQGMTCTKRTIWSVGDVLQSVINCWHPPITFPATLWKQTAFLPVALCCQNSFVHAKQQVGLVLQDNYRQIIRPSSLHTDTIICISIVSQRFFQYWAKWTRSTAHTLKIIIIIKTWEHLKWSCMMNHYSRSPK